jgi:urease accessory protein
VNAPVVARDAGGWVGRLDLQIERDRERSLLARQSHVGPLYVQRPFYPEGPGLVHFYLLHPPGGVVGGDRLDVSVSLGPRASALVTTPAAQKLYRSSGAESMVETRLSLAPDATLEWLPSETIVFDGARARQLTRIDLAAGAGLIGWEISCLGRPASGVRFSRGRVALGLDLRREGAPLLIERLAIEGGSRVLDEAWGFGQKPIAGTLYAVPRSAESGISGPAADDLEPPATLPELVEKLRSLAATPGTTHSVTLLGDALVLRALGDKLEAVRALFVRSWELLRPVVIGRNPARPRIWATWRSGARRAG